MREIEYIEIHGVNFSLIPIIPFESWIIRKYGNIKKFEDLSHKDKEKIFLRWKWGFEDERANENLEMSEKMSLYLFKDNDLSQENEAWRFYIQKKRDFDKICYETLLRIDIISQDNPLQQKLKQTFEGEII